MADAMRPWLIVQLLLYVLSAIAVLRWVYVTNANAQQFGDGLTISPSGAVMWFFVPVACLFKPFVGVSESWRATVDQRDPDSVATPPILRWWWGLWLTYGFLGATQLIFDRGTGAAHALLAAIDAGRLVIAVLLAFVFARVIARLSAMQSQVLARLADVKE